MLRACRRALKPGGRIAYYNILINDGLPADERRKIAKDTPDGVYTPAQQQGLLHSAGFTRIQETDVSAEFLRVQRALVDANERHARGLRRALGAADFDDRQARRGRTIRALEAGHRRRSLLVAERPQRARRG